MIKPAQRSPVSQPPKMARRNIPWVLWELLLRMRLDLLLVLALCGVALAIKADPQIQDLSVIDGAGLSMLGIAVSIFVGFRNTQAINRWWEARVLWGAITNEARQWRDTLQTLIGGEEYWRRQQQELVALQVLQCWVLNFELRGLWRSDARAHVDALTRSLGLTEDITLQQSLRHRAQLLGDLYSQGAINDWGRDALLRCSTAFLNSLGGLQRIRNTPLPPTYDVFIRLICWVYGYALFASFASRDSAWTGAVLFLGFITAERIGSYVEGPFDQDGSSFCVPMDSICSTISADLLQASPLGQLPISRDPSRWS